MRVKAIVVMVLAVFAFLSAALGLYLAVPALGDLIALGAVAAWTWSVSEVYAAWDRSNQNPLFYGMFYLFISFVLFFSIRQVVGWEKKPQTEEEREWERATTLG